MTRPITFVTSYPPSRSHLGGGGWIDSRLVRALVDAGADVELFAVTGPVGTWEDLGVVGRAEGAVPLEVRGSRRALAKVAARVVTRGEPYLSAKFTAFAGWSEAADALAEASRGRAVITSQWPPLLLATSVPIHVDVHVAHNVDSVIAGRHAPLPLRMLAEERRLRRLERRLLRAPSKVVTLSRADARRLADWSIPATQLTVPLGAVESSRPSRRHVGFIGKASWPPNHEALETLLGPVADALDAAGTDARFVLGGTGTEVYAGRSRVETTGFVEDLEDFYREVDVVVIPRLGDSTGISVKMLEAVEHDVPVIVPRALADAVDPDGPWIVADSPAEIAAAIGRIDADDDEERSRRAAMQDWRADRSGGATARQLLDLLG